MKAGTSVIFLPCRDIEKTRHFYHEILGLRIEQKQGDNLYIFDTGYGYWGFVQYPGRPRTAKRAAGRLSFSESEERKSGCAAALRRRIEKPAVKYSGSL